MRVIFLIFALCSVIWAFNIDVEAGGTLDRKKVEAYLNARKEANEKIKEFKKIYKTDPKLAKKMVLEIQKDPLAITLLNEKKDIKLKEAFKKHIKKIEEDTLNKFREKFVKEYNRAHPKEPIEAKDITFKEFTNPSKELKIGHDWDVTIYVKGKELHYKKGEKIFHESYFEAAGGKELYPNSNPKEFADSRNVVVTSSKHPEAFKNGKDFIDNPSAKTLQDAEGTTKIEEYKSNLERNKAIDYEKQGKQDLAEVYKGEHARQITKQYDKHVVKIVKDYNGKIPEILEKKVNVLKRVGKYSHELGRVFTSEDAEYILRTKYNDTIEGVGKKVASQIEASHKLNPNAKQNRPLIDVKADINSIENKKVINTQEPPTIEEPIYTSKTKIKENGGFIKNRSFKKISNIVDKTNNTIMIFNSAQDIVDGVEGKKSWTEVGEKLLDTALQGTISTTKDVIGKNRAFKDTIKYRNQAQEAENRRVIFEIGKDLEQNGLDKESVHKIMDDLRKGDKKSYIEALHKLRKEGKNVGVIGAKYIDLEGPDDTITQRTKKVAIDLIDGTIESGKRAGKFIIYSTKNVTDIATTVPDILITEYNAKKNKEENVEAIREKLLKSGLSKEATDLIIKRFKEGDNSLLKNFAKTLQHEAKIEKRVLNKLNTIENYAKETLQSSNSFKSEKSLAKEILSDCKHTRSLLDIAKGYSKFRDLNAKKIKPAWQKCENSIEALEKKYAKLKESKSKSAIIVKLIDKLTNKPLNSAKMDIKCQSFRDSPTGRATVKLLNIPPGHCKFTLYSTGYEPSNEIKVLINPKEKRVYKYTVALMPIEGLLTLDELQRAIPLIQKPFLKKLTKKADDILSLTNKLYQQATNENLDVQNRNQAINRLKSLMSNIKAIINSVKDMKTILKPLINAKGVTKEAEETGYVKEAIATAKQINYLFNEIIKEFKIAIDKIQNLSYVKKQEPKVNRDKEINKKRDIKSQNSKLEQCIENVNKKISKYISSNLKNDPTSSVGTVTINASKKCSQQHKVCFDRAWQRGKKCQQSPYSGSIQEKMHHCNTISNKGYIKCAVEENKCSQSVLIQQCKEKFGSSKTKPIKKEKKENYNPSNSRKKGSILENLEDDLRCKPIL